MRGRPRHQLAWKFQGACIRSTSHRPDKTTGYVRLTRWQSGRRINLKVPRLILQRRLGHAPDVARHTCDNPWCINPEHILNGSVTDNNRDKASRGRAHRPVGVANGMAKLTETQVKEIRKSSLSPRELADIHGVTKENIHHITNNKTWRHIT